MQKVRRFFGALRIVHYLFIMGKNFAPHEAFEAS